MQHNTIAEGVRHLQYGRLGKIPSAKTSNLITPTHLSSVLLSVWDNILGPRLDHEWRGSDQLDREILDYLSTRTLDSECCRDVEDGAAFETKFTVLAEHGLLSLSLIFTAIHGGVPSRMALTLAMSERYLESYLNCHFVVEDRFKTLASWLIRQYQHTGDSATSDFTPHLQMVCQNIDRLMECSLPPAQLSLSWLSQSQDSAAPYPFLSRAITAYLTHGSAVVVGTDISQINKMISTLVLFASDLQRKRSAMATPDSTFTPDLYLQGVLTERFTFHSVFWSILPVAIIDVSTGLVRRCHKLHEYQLCRASLLQEELDLGPTGSYTEQYQLQLQKENTTILNDSAQLVDSLIHELRQLPEAVRYPTITNWKRLLERRAVTLIECTRPFRDQVQSAGGTKNEKLIKRIKDALRLPLESDWYMVLAAADRLQPGIFRAVEGDVSVVTERFQMLMEYF